MIRIVMADDHAIVRAGFRSLIEDEPGFRIVAECGDTDDTRRACATLRPDVLVLDLSLPGGGGLALLPELRSALPQMAVLVLSMHDDNAYVAEALRRGANGYVTKGTAHRELPDALQAVMRGETWLSSDVRGLTNPSVIAGLSKREYEVFLRLARGESVKQIALDFGISDKTLYQHRESIRNKLGVRDDLGLHRIALERGLL
jgi:two-component system uhpT operon response regulator UhpA